MDIRRIGCQLSPRGKPALPSSQGRGTFFNTTLATLGLRLHMNTTLLTADCCLLLTIVELSACGIPTSAKPLKIKPNTMHTTNHRHSDLVLGCRYVVDHQFLSDSTPPCFYC